MIYESYNEKTPTSSFKTIHTIKGDMLDSIRKADKAKPEKVKPVEAKSVEAKPEKDNTYNPKKDGRRKQSVYE